ncbi:hypothetical protein IWQ57_004512, partial [Coemansia nantahalensis]
MEFWKRKKATGSAAPPAGGNLNAAQISEPIHHFDAPVPLRSSNQPLQPPAPPGPVVRASSPRSQALPMPGLQQSADDSEDTGDAEFREQYRSYRQQRRLSHTNSSVRSSQQTVISDLGGATSNLYVDTAPPLPQQQQQQQQQVHSPGGFHRQWSHESDTMPTTSLRTGSIVSTTSSTSGGGGGGLDRPHMTMSASYIGDDQAKFGSTSGPPRGSLRSTRSAATGRGAGPPPLMSTAVSSSVGEAAFMSTAGRSTSLGMRAGAPKPAASGMAAAGGSMGGRRGGMVGIGMGMQTELDPSTLGEEEVNLMLGRLMDEMDIKETQRLQMQKMSMPNKLKLLKQQRQLETFQMDSKGNAPEYFYRYLTETDIRSLPKQMLVHLRVCVTTQPVNWVKQFVDMQGLEALSECLGILNHAGMRRGDDITKEIEIIKCIKSVVNIQWGAQDVLRYPACVHNLCFSIDAPSLLTRRLISEILTYICYLNVPTGHATVLKGLDKLQKFREMQKRFEPWMRALELAIDGRGRMGSKVGVSEELRQLGSTADRDLTDYVLSSMIFINAVVGVSDD